MCQLQSDAGKCSVRVLLQALRDGRCREATTADGRAEARTLSEDESIGGKVQSKCVTFTVASLQRPNPTAADKRFRDRWQSDTVGVPEVETIYYINLPPKYEKRFREAV